MSERVREKKYKKVHIVKTWAGGDGRVLDASWNFLLMNHISSCSCVVWSHIKLQNAFCLINLSARNKFFITSYKLILQKYKNKISVNNMCARIELNVNIYFI